MHLTRVENSDTKRVSLLAHTVYFKILLSLLKYKEYKEKYNKVLITKWSLAK